MFNYHSLSQLESASGPIKSCGKEDMCVGHSALYLPRWAGPPGTFQAYRPHP